MNHSFRSLWNTRTGTFVAVPETATARGGRCSSSVRSAGRSVSLLTPLALALSLAHGAWAAAPSSAAQLPSGGVVKAGSATIGTSGNAMTVNQASNRAVIDWNSFNVGARNTVDFVQPGANAVTLNRVVGNEGSVIDGALNANGQVFLLNPNGVLFGKHAVVDTGGLLASTLDISNADFMAGRSVLRSTGKLGSVVNQGRLTAPDGGYIALIGNRVSNDGVITARLGTVALASGDQVTLNFNGTSLVDVTIDRATYDALVENHRIIVADGGLVKLTASTADGLLDTVVNNTGVIQSRTVATRDGHVYLLGEGGKVEVGGTLDASAPNGGDGGHIETSGPTVQVADGAKITTSAAHGRTGTWLVDPTDFTVAASGGDITGATLSAELATTDVTLQSSSGASGTQGNVNVNDAVHWSAHTLTLEAGHDIDVNAVITATGSANLNLAAGSNNVYMGLSDAGFHGRVDFSGSGTLQMNVNGVLTPFTVLNTASDLQALNNSLGGGNFAIGSDLDLTSVSWTPIGTNSNKFDGLVDGLGHVAQNLDLTINASGAVFCQGLFGAVSGTLRNLGVSDGHIEITGNNNAVSHIGLLVGQLSGTLDHTYATGSISVSSTIPNNGVTGGVGGLVGEMNVYQSTGTPNQVLSSFANADIQATVAGSRFQYVGGLVGDEAGGTIRNSYSEGTVVGYQEVGGLVGGVLDGSPGYGVFGSYSTASVDGQFDGVGGFIGYNQGAVQDSYSSGTVVAHGTGMYGSVGGFIGNNTGVITTSYTASPVVTTWLIGTSTDYYNGNGYVAGAVIGADWGRWDNAAQVNRQSAHNVIYNASVAGSLPAAGFLYDTTLDSYGFIPDGPTGIGLTTAQMKSQANFTGATVANGNLNPGLDFANTWVMYDGQTLPMLRAFLTPLTVTPSITLTKVYDGSAATGTVSYLTGTGQAVDPAHLFGTATLAGAGRNVGTYTVAPTDVWSDQQGYLLTYASASTAVTPASLTVSATGGTQVYNGSTAANVTLGSNAISGDALTLADTSATMANKNVGTNKTVSVGGISVSGPDAGNYVLQNTTASTTTNVTPASLAVTATGGTQVYDATINANVTLASNAIDGDLVTLAAASATMANKNVGTNKAVSVGGISIAGADAGNYVLQNTTASTTTDVTPASLTVSATGGTQVYDATTHAKVTLGSNAIGGDAVLLADAAATLVDKNVGNGKAVAVSGISISGADAANYVLQNTTASTTTDVTPATLSVTASAANQALANGTNVAVTLAGDAIAGDQVMLRDGSATVADTSVGPGKGVTVDGIAIAGADAGNYLLASTRTTTTVTVLPPVVQAPPIAPGIVGSAVQTPVTPSAKFAADRISAALAIPLPLSVVHGGDAGVPSWAVFATPGSATDAGVTLTGLSSMMRLAPGQDVVVPVGNSKFVSLLNGGVKLPSGVEQQFFINAHGH